MEDDRPLDIGFDIAIDRGDVVVSIGDPKLPDLDAPAMFSYHFC